MRSIIIFVACSVISSPLIAKDEKQPELRGYIYDCKSDREFITTYEFLKSRSEFALNPRDMRETALAVADGCTGAASHFIEITELLIKAHLDGRTALKTAIEVAGSGDKAARAFVRIFKSAFAKDYFDLDVAASTRLAKRLTAEFKGDPGIAGDDFEELAKFCTSDLGAGLTRSKCSQLVERLILVNAEGKLRIAGAFREAFVFLTNRDEINLTPGDAVLIAETMVSTSPDAVPVFRKTYQYALDSSGLGLSRPEAVKFASAVAAKTKRPKPE